MVCLCRWECSLSLWVRRFAQQTVELPVVNLIPPKLKPTDRVDIPRCDFCRAYVNPFIEFLEGGKKFQCNICDRVQLVPSTYFQPLEAGGLRRNFESSPELFSGSVEFLANEDYASRGPKEPTYFFVVEISRSATAALVPAYALAAIKELLRSARLNGERNATFGIAFLDAQLHLLQIRNKQPLLVTLNAASFPNNHKIPAERFLTYLDSLQEAEIDAVFDKLSPAIGFSNSELSLQSLEDSLRYVTEIVAGQGGKVSVILGGEESFPPKGADGDPSKRSYFSANDQCMARIAAYMHQWLISMDLYVFGHGKYKNLASLAEGVRMGGGDSCYYPVASQTELHKFYNELIFNCSKIMSWESVFRIRCNTGWKKRAFSNYYGSVGNDLMRPEQVDENYSVFFLFEEEDKTSENKPKVGKDTFYIQTSLLYTNSKRQRMIRVHNYCLPISSRLKKVYEAMDYQAVTSALVRQSAADFLESKPLPDMQIDLVNRMKKLFAGISQSTSPDFQVENLPYLTVAFLGVLKSDALLAKYINNFKGNSVDIVSQQRTLINRVSYDVIFKMMNPTLLNLAGLGSETCITQDEQFVFPPSLRLNQESLEAEHVPLALLDDGLSLHLYILEFAYQPRLGQVS